MFFFVCPLPNPFMCPCNCCRQYPIQACPYRGHVGIGYSLCCSFSFFQRPAVSTFEATKALVRKARREDGSISVSGAPDLKDSQAYTEEFGQSLLDAYACAELSMSTNNLEVEAGVTLNSGVKNSSTSNSSQKLKTIEVQADATCVEEVLDNVEDMQPVWETGAFEEVLEFIMK